MEKSRWYRSPVVWIVAIWLITFGVLLVRTVPVSGDGIYYFVQLESIVLDGDVDFTNNLLPFADNPHVQKQIESGVTTPVGLTPNLFSVGPALLWSPFYLASLPFSDGHLAVSIATSIYVLAGLLLAYDFLRRAIKRSMTAAFAVISIFVGTNLLYYSTFEASMSHGLGFFAVALLFWLWWRWRLRPVRSWKTTVMWLIIGLAAGLAGLVRWQLLGVAVIVPLFDIFWRTINRAPPVDDWSKVILQGAKRIGLVLLGMFIAFIPQLIVWRYLYGQWFVIPQGSGFLDWSSPHFAEVLTSNRHGLLMWSPVVAMALAGLIVAFITRAKCALKLGLIAVWVFLVFFLQTIINGSAIEWWGEDAFGPRRFTDISIVFMVGMAALLLISKRAWWRWLIRALIVVLVAANLLFMQAYRHGFVPRDEPVTLDQAVEAVSDYLR